jgi:hypothetical protein
MRVGDRVRVRAGHAHDGETADAVGTVVEIATAALGVQFDGMAEVHRWYVAAELQPADDQAALLRRVTQRGRAHGM